MQLSSNVLHAFQFKYSFYVQIPHMNNIKWYTLVGFVKELLNRYSYISHSSLVLQWCFTTHT